MRQLALIASLMAGPACAQEWAPMTGPEIQSALSDQKLIYSGGITQEFYASGRTLYVSSRPEWGYWAVRGDQYCSQWPPSDLWACYDMARQGDVLRFIGEAGDSTDGTFAD